MLCHVITPGDSFNITGIESLNTNSCNEADQKISYTSNYIYTFLIVVLVHCISCWRQLVAQCEKITSSLIDSEHLDKSIACQTENDIDQGNKILNQPKDSLEETMPAKLTITISEVDSFQAPLKYLRVEELKEEDGMSSAHSSCCSEEEGVLSHGEASDRDEQSRSPQPVEEFVPPDEELKNTIIQQVQFYFSDANILKDAFLLKHVRRNKQGYVSLKLITSFRKLKSLTKDFRVVAYSLRQSEELEVNEEGTKVRRLKPLPDYDETTPSRTVVAVNLPFESPTIENVAELFRSCGEISLIRVLRPGKTIPPDVKKHIMKHPELGNVVCAVIEFEQHESAQQAVGNMTNSDDWRKGLRVVLLSQPKKKVDKKQKAGESSKTSEQKNEINKNEGESGEEKKKKKRNKKKSSRVEELTKTDGDSPSSGSDPECVEKDSLAGGEPQRRKSSGTAPSNMSARSSLSPKPDYNRLSPSNTPRSSPRTTPRSSPKSSPRGSPIMRRKSHGKSPLAQSGAEGLSPGTSPCVSPESRRKNSGAELGTSPGGSPWVQRRLKAQQEGSPLVGRSPGTSPRLGRRLLDHEGVVRQPKGPDGSKGFHPGAGRGKPVTCEA